MNEINFIFAFFLGFMVCLLLERVLGPMLDDIVKKANKQDPPLPHPCETCPRWEECNGVDDTCPLIKEEDDD